MGWRRMPFRELRAWLDLAEERGRVRGVQEFNRKQRERWEKGGRP